MENPYNEPRHHGGFNVTIGNEMLRDMLMEIKNFHWEAADKAWKKTNRQDGKSAMSYAAAMREYDDHMAQVARMRWLIQAL